MLDTNAAPSANPLRVDADLYARAIAEGAPALAELALAAEAAITAGNVDRERGLTVAGLFRRMAAERDATGTGAGHLACAEVMLRQERVERDAGQSALAIVTGAFALRALARAADAGNEDAAQRLTAVGPALLPETHAMAREWMAGEQAEEHAGYDRTLLDASRGDADALAVVIAEVVSENTYGVMPDDETIALCEQIGRLGLAAGHLALAVQLSGALLARGRVEREAGRTDAAIVPEAEGLTVMAAAVRAGHVEAAGWLPQLMDLTLPTSVALAAKSDPLFLLSIPAKGGA